MQAYMVWRPVKFQCTSRVSLDGNALEIGEPTHGIEILGVFTDRAAAEKIRGECDGDRPCVFEFPLDESYRIWLDATFPKERGA